MAFSSAAQDKPQKIKKKSLLTVEVGYLSDSPFRNIKYKIAVQHTFWDFVGVSAGYWHYSDQYLEDGIAKSTTSINSLDFSLGLVPVYTRHSFLSLGGGYSYAYLNQITPVVLRIDDNTQKIVGVLSNQILKSWTGGWHLYLRYHYNFKLFFVGTSLYYYSFNDIHGKYSFSGFNTNIDFGILF